MGPTPPPTRGVGNSRGLVFLLPSLLEIASAPRVLDVGEGLSSASLLHSPKYSLNEGA